MNGWIWYAIILLVFAIGLTAFSMVCIHRSNMSISDDRPYRIIATVAGVLATSCFITAIVALGIGVTSHGIQ